MDICELVTMLGGGGRHMRERGSGTNCGFNGRLLYLHRLEAAFKRSIFADCLSVFVR